MYRNPARFRRKTPGEDERQIVVLFPAACSRAALYRQGSWVFVVNPSIGSQIRQAEPVYLIRRFVGLRLLFGHFIEYIFESVANLLFQFCLRLLGPICLSGKGGVLGGFLSFHDQQASGIDMDTLQDSEDYYYCTLVQFSNLII